MNPVAHKMISGMIISDPSIKNKKLGIDSKVFTYTSGAIVKVAKAIQLSCIIPHPTNYLLPKFEANWSKLTELLNGSHCKGRAVGNGAMATLFTAP